MNCVNSFYSRMLLALALVLAAASSTRADEIEYTYYYVKDNLGNRVATPAFSMIKSLWNRTQIMLDVELDQATSPPLPDGVSGASRPQRHSQSEFRRNRGQIISGVEQGLGDNTRLNASYYFSQEVDYISHSIVGGISRDFLQKNHTWTFRAQYTLDSVGQILANGQIHNRFKETHQASLVISQIMSPTSLLRVGGDAMRNHGFLSDPYSMVPDNWPQLPVSTDTVIENHPSMRYRQAVWAEMSQYLSGLEGSLILTYRYYWDDWNMASHTLSFKLNKYITPDWILSPEYRYYDQKGADYGDYAKSLPADFFHAKDYKLGSWQSHNTGMGLTCFLRTFSKKHPTWDFLTNTSIAVLYFHYFNNSEDKNFTADIFEARMKFAF